MEIQKKLSHGLVCGTAALALLSPSLSSAGEPRFIGGGEVVEECGWAPVMFVNGCTALLVHPEIVFYAAHCGTSGKTNIHFTHKNGQGKSVATEKCKVNPNWSGNQSGGLQKNDWAYCKLKEPVTELPIVPVAFGCELDDIKAMTDIVQCGFGANVGKNAGYGTKRWGANTIARITDNGNSGTVKTSPNLTVGCPGDSGGPMLTKLKDGTWRTIGVASTIDTGYDSCGKPGAVNSYAYIPAGGVAWVEKDSGVDITPCFESDGTWKPTAECGGFFMGDHTPHGKWDNWCEGTPKSGFSSTCGDPFGSEPPMVSIKSPTSGTKFEEGEDIEVEVDASDKEKVDKVELFLDGATKGTDTTAPYEFTLEKIEVGDHEIYAIATNSAMMEKKSDVVEIVVEEGSDESTSTGDDDDDTTTTDDDDDDDTTTTDDDDDDSDDDDDDSDDDDDNDDDSDDDDDDDDDDSDDDDDDDDDDDSAPPSSSSTPSGEKSSGDDSGVVGSKKSKGCSTVTMSGSASALWLGAMGLGFLARRRRQSKT